MKFKNKMLDQFLANMQLLLSFNLQFKIKRYARSLLKFKNQHRIYVVKQKSLLKIDE